MWQNQKYICYIDSFTGLHFLQVGNTEYNLKFKSFGSLSEFKISHLKIDDNFETYFEFKYCISISFLVLFLFLT